MNRARHLSIVAVLAAAHLTLVAGQTSPAAELFQRGLLLERADGNLAQAVVLFERVVAEFPKDQAVLPQALVHLARLYEGTDPQRAALLWSRLATEFSSSAYADEARRKLTAAQAQEAGPFPMRSLDDALAVLDQFEAELSLDGRMVAYIRRDQQGARFIVRNVDSGEDRVVFAEPGLNLENVDWSPDSQHVAFLIWDPRDTSLEAWQDLRIFTPATGQLRSLARSAGVMGGVGYWWSADSRRILIHVRRVGRRESALQFLDVSSGESHFVPVETPSGIAWSRDGRQVVFQSRSGGQVTGFWIAAADGGTLRPLSVPLEPVNRVALALSQRLWSTPDEILVRHADPAGGASFYLVPVNGGPLKKTCTATPGVRTCGEITPDGTRQLAVDEANRRLMLIDLASGHERRVSISFGDEESPMLSSDGRLLAFVSNADGSWALYVVPVDRPTAAAPVRLASLDEHPRATAFWGRDGRLAVRLNYDNNQVYRINMDASGRATGPAGRLTQDSTQAYTASVSPDSTRIAYWYANGAKRGSAVMAADGSGEHPVLDGFPGPWGWLNTDEALSWRSGGAGKPASVVALNVKTGVVRPVFELAAPTVIGFTSPAGSAGTVPTQNLDSDHHFVEPLKEVVYWHGDPRARSRTIRAHSLTTGADRVVATIEVEAGLLGWRLSPDGSTLAYSRWVRAGDARVAELHLVTVETGADRVVLSTPRTTQGWNAEGPYDWSPDSRFLLYDEFPGSLTTGTLRVMDVRTGESWPISQATNSSRERWYNAQWAPDGSFITISRFGRRTEYRLFEGVTHEAVVRLADTGSGR